MYKAIKAKLKRWANRLPSIERTLGYVLLAFCTFLFSLSMAMGKLYAGVQLLMFCAAILIALNMKGR